MRTDRLCLGRLCVEANPQRHLDRVEDGHRKDDELPAHKPRRRRQYDEAVIPFNVLFPLMDVTVTATVKGAKGAKRAQA